MDELNFEQRIKVRCKQGRPAFGLEMKIVDDEGNSLPHDGVAFGKLMVRGPRVIESYYKANEERPLLIAVKKEGCDPSKASILDIISSEHAKWQLPDDVVFIDEMPLTATGKIDKKPLRIKYENYLMEE